MIVYGVKKVGDKLMFNGRDVRLRTSDKRKRIYERLSKYRKKWWHFKTRWDPQ
jgi:hypothetical protein